MNEHAHSDRLSPQPGNAEPPSRPGALRNDAGLAVEWLWHGGLRSITWQDLAVNLFPGAAAEAGPANLWLRELAADGGVRGAQALLGPGGILRPGSANTASTRNAPGMAGGSGASPAPSAAWSGQALGLDIELVLQLAADAPSLAWHLRMSNVSDQPQCVDVQALLDIGLAPWGAIRLNEYYVSQYVDLQPLNHPRLGWMVAARQNQAVGGRHPWCLMGSMGRAVSLATDAWQWCGTALRAGERPPGLRNGLPAERLQHEHALIALQEAPVRLAPGEVWQGGFFLVLQGDHPAATSAADRARIPGVLAAHASPWPVDPVSVAAARAAVPTPTPTPGRSAAPAAEPAASRRATAAPAASPDGSLFSRAPWWPAAELSDAEVARLWPGPRLHAEHDAQGRLLSFFREDGAHVVLRAKECQVQRPHGHLLRSGRHIVPDETALTSTAWMTGAFHSMLTQGHVGINRCLGTVRSALGLFRGQGQRVFAHTGDGRWQQLGLPSAFEMQEDRCRWWYRHDGGLLRVDAWAEHAPHAMGLSVEVLDGAPLYLCLTHDIALGGEDSWPPLPLNWSVTADAVVVAVPPGSDLASRFPDGTLVLRPQGGTAGLHIRGDEALYADGRGHGEPYLVIEHGATRRFVLRLQPRLVTCEPVAAGSVPLPRWSTPAGSADAGALQRLEQIVPWFAHNALVHYLSPRGLEQFSGGGWGTRDVCQGPLEMLLALDRPQAVRDLLCRVFSAQDPGGDWPQWFMFFERERHIRAGDAHGDIVFWPLLGLARYLVCTQDVGLLDEPLPLHAAPGEPVHTAPLWQHIERAWDVVRARQFPGTRLVNYGHGDWNDSLQPADPSLRERLCSSWTVTLHHQVLHTMADALSACGRDAAATPLREEAGRLRDDFRRLLLRDGTVGGYALFDGGARPGDPPALLLHPQDTRTGVQHSLLPLMHAVLENLLTPQEARAQLATIESKLLGPDGARLFDRPLTYHGGPQRLFQRAESSAFFGREIGMMYMHAHLRYAEMLAHLGEGQRLLDALQRIHPIGLQAVVPSATRRQSNCYYSSSDAAFSDRYTASAAYGRIADGSVPLDGGWRVYSSGPGLALSLIVGGFLGVRRCGARVTLDPVMPPTLDGLCAEVPVDGLTLELTYRLGPLGHGTQAVQISGETLSPADAVSMPHAYRAGGLSVSLAALHGHAADGRVPLTVVTG